MRIHGDRSWSFQTNGDDSCFQSPADLVYTFKFDDRVDPHFAEITPGGKDMGEEGFPRWVMAFNMQLLTKDQSPYPDSFVWHRTSCILGDSICATDAQDASGASYHVVQVIDGDGERLPAFSDFVRYCESQAPSRDGSRTLGSIWYYSFEEPRADADCSDLAVDLDKCPTLLKAMTDTFGSQLASMTASESSVFDDYTFVAHSIFVLALQSARHFVIPNSTMCGPIANKTTLSCVAAYGFQTPNEEVDPSVQGGECAITTILKPLQMCAFHLMRNQPMDDGVLGAPGNTPENSWDLILDEAIKTKEDYVMSHFDYQNPDGKPIYPIKEIDFGRIFRDSGGGFVDMLEGRLALDVLGTHLVSEVAEPQEINGERAVLVVETSGLALFRRRPGFAAWGADMFFNKDGQPLMIRTPEGRTVEPRSSDWRYWKFVFRSSLFNRVTLVDHLWFTHYTAAASMAKIARKVITADHPLRRLLTMLTFGTIAVNYDGVHMLVGPSQILHRMSPFEDWEEVATVGEARVLPGFRGYFECFVNHTAWQELHPRVRQTPFYEDGKPLFAAMSRLIEKLFGLYPQWCSSDSADEIVDPEVHAYVRGVEAWLRKFRTAGGTDATWLKGTSAAWTCAGAKRMLTVQMFAVSGFHRHVGHVADLVRNPELVGSAWVYGEDAPRPRQAIQYAALAASTGKVAPKIHQDYSHLFAGVERGLNAREVLGDFREQLLALERVIDKRNTERELPYFKMHPRHVESSVSV